LIERERGRQNRKLFTNERCHCDFGGLTLKQGLEIVVFDVFVLCITLAIDKRCEGEEEGGKKGEREKVTRRVRGREKERQERETDRREKRGHTQREKLTVLNLSLERI
jgi:hypothetical protein